MSKRKKTPNDIIKDIEKKTKKETCIFRGEPKNYGLVKSSLYRQYSTPEHNNLTTEKYFSVLQVEEDMINAAKKHIRPEATDMEVLTELQHYGGKTALIDFTRSIHIALFFACNGEFDEDGRVIIVKKETLDDKTPIDYGNNKSKENIENIEKHNILAVPTGKSPRVIFQSSVFVHAYKGVLDDNDYEPVDIPKTSKKEMLRHLQTNYGISTDTVYNDIHGFISNQNDFTTAYIEFYTGLTYQNKGDKEKTENNLLAANESYNKAKEHYTQAIELAPQSAVAYNNRGIVHAALGKHDKALTDYTQAIKLNPNYVNAYNNRGTAQAALEKYEQAVTDYTQAIKLNPKSAKAYYNRGIAYYEQAKPDYENAIADLREAHKLYQEQGNTKDAEEAAELIKKIEETMGDMD